MTAVPSPAAEAYVDSAKLKPGQTIWSLTMPAITRTDIVRYTGASGDFTLIHHDEPFAMKAGNPSVFVMGLYPAGILAAQLGRYFDPRSVRRFGVRFTDKIWPGDVLTYSATVSQAGDEVQLDLLVCDQNGTRKLAGSAIIASI